MTGFWILIIYITSSHTPVYTHQRVFDNVQQCQQKGHEMTATPYEYYVCVPARYAV